MIQRTVVASKRASIDQRLASGVGTLGTEYAALLKSGRDELANLPRNVVMQKAVVTNDQATVKRLADLASRGGLVVTVADAHGKLMTSRQPAGAREIGSPITIGRPRVATIRAYADTGALIAQTEPSRDVTLGIAVGDQLQLGDEKLTLPRALLLGRPFGLTLQGTHYRAAASEVADSRVVALYPQHLLDSYTRSIRLKIALFMGLLLLLIGAGAALAVRSLTHTLRAFADGIRAVAAGRFDQRLPVRGSDEFSQFGEVFNQMSTQLEQRIDELDSERRRVQEFGQRFGAALAATHDVASLL
jgi:methyl-accepting chemotaxis protein